MVKLSSEFNYLAYIFPSKDDGYKETIDFPIKFQSIVKAIVILNTGTKIAKYSINGESNPLLDLPVGHERTISGLDITRLDIQVQAESSVQIQCMTVPIR